MLLLAASLVVSSFSGFVIAMISAPDCSLTWEWSFNSLGQNACTVAAYMMSTCNVGSYTVDPLQPGHSYTGAGGTDDSNLCKCSTVGYSLISACTGCQGRNWISWSEYVTNCTETLPPSSFPNPIPSGTRVPYWALLDVTKEDFWNANESLVAGDFPEVGPGGILGLSTPSVSASVSTSAFGGTLTTPAFIGRHNSNSRAIVGGVIGGIAAIFIFVAALFFYWRRRRSLVHRAPVYDGDITFDPHMEQDSWSTSSQGTVLSCFTDMPSLSGAHYLEYPITYSEYRVTSPPPAYISGQVPSLSPSRGRYTVGTTPNSQAWRYHDLSTARVHPLN